MKLLIAILILVSILYLYTNGFILREPFDHESSVECSKVDNRCYRIQNKYDPKTHKMAADTLAALNATNIKFINYLKKKYLTATCSLNRGLCSTKFRKLKEMCKNLIKRYRPSALKEHAPKSIKNTSYVFAKGKEIGYCLREKKTGGNKIHKIDTLLFVNLHEITHLAGTEYDQGHSRAFWKNFKIILKEAIESGLYNPVDYKRRPVEYCGIPIAYNPVFDENLTVSY